MEKAQALLQQLLTILEQAQAENQYQVLYANLRVTLALLQNRVFYTQVNVTPIAIENIHSFLIKLANEAKEVNFHTYLNEKLAQPFYVLINAIDSKLAQRLQAQFKQMLLFASPIADFSLLFSELKAISDDQVEFKLNTLKLKFHTQQDKRVKQLKQELEHYRYRVLFDLLVPYLKALVEQDSGQLNLAHLQQLLKLLESAWYIKQAQLMGHELLWHALLALQNTLDVEGIGHLFPAFAALNSFSPEISNFTYGESILGLQAVAQQINSANELEAILDLFEVALALNHRLSQLLLTHINFELFKDKQSHLQNLRTVFETEPDSVTAQKQFSMDTLHFLNELLQASISLIGEPPFDMALCVLGSSSRMDRRPYSDIELMLLYHQPEHKKLFKNKYQAHQETQRINLYLYHLLGLIELTIVSLGESHIQSLHTQEIGTGFHLDNSCHVLKKELFGTPHQMVTQHITQVIQTIDKTTVMQNHPWFNGESFFALLQPKLINSDNQYDSQDVIKAYSTEKEVFLEAIPSAEDEIAVLHQFLKLKGDVDLFNLKRRQLIALSTLQHVLDISKDFFELNPGDIVDIKAAFYKPLAYLALSLKLFYNLAAEHPVDIFEVVSQQLEWGQSPVFKLLSIALKFIAQLQNTIHLQARQQEEHIIWLKSATANVPAYQLLEPVDYAALDLIQHSLLKPLAQTLPTYFEKPCEQYKHVLIVLLQQHLKQRNLAWVEKWEKHSTQSVLAQVLLAHPLIQALADYPSPDGWSPNYEQSMCDWLQQLQTLLSTEQSPCLIEGVPTAQQKVSYLPQAIVTQLFDVKGEFKGNVHHSPQSKVSQITLQIPGQADPTTFYFKVKSGNEAGLMGREFAVINLHQLLGGQSHIALGWPLKLTYMTNKGAKVYYCWVSQSILGKSLAEMMQTEADFVNFQAQLQMQSYSHLFVTHYLTCPEDAQPENFKVVQTNNETILIGLDVGQSFVGTYDEARRVLTVKSMLYLLEGPIKKPLNTAVLTRLMLLKPHALMVHWQANLQQINHRFQLLFEAELKKTRIPKAEWFKHNKLIDLTDEIKRCVQLRLDLLQNWLYDYSTQPKTGLRLLKTLDKAVAFSYQSLLGKIKTAKDFYQKIDTKAYRNIDAKTAANGKMISTTIYTQIKQNSLTPELLQRSLDLGEEYFANIDFKKFEDAEEQVFIFRMIQAAADRKRPLKYLNLSSCTVINENKLIELLQKLPTLIELQLADCPQFNLSTVYTLLSLKLNEKLVFELPPRREYKVLCPQLRKLTVTLEGKKHVFNSALTLAGRKDLVSLITARQQQIESYRKRLLVMQDDKDSNVRVAAAQSLMQLAVRLSEGEVEAVVQGLLEGLRNEYRDVRAAAVQSLGLLAAWLSEEQVDAVVKSLLNRLGDQDNEDKDLREAAAQSLRQLAARLSKVQVKAVVKALLDRLRDEVGYVRVGAVQSLGQLASWLPEAEVEAVVQGLLNRLRDEVGYVRAGAARSLGQMAAWLSKAELEAVVQGLLDQLGDQHIHVQVAAAHSLKQLAAWLSGVHVKAVAQRLLDQLRDKEWYVRAVAPKSLEKFAARLLGEQVEAVAVVNDLLDWLGDYRENVRQAAQSLRKLPELSREEVEAVLDRMGDYRENVRLTAAKSLEKLVSRLSGVQVAAVVNVLLDQLEDKSRNVRAAVAQSLSLLAARLSILQEEAMIRGLLDRLGDEIWYVRAAAAQSLGLLAARLSVLQEEAVVKALLARLEDKEKYVRVAAVNSLAKIFSSAASLQWLQKNLLQNERTVIENLPHKEAQENQAILFKFFFFLDQKTLLQAVPQVNKDWQRWQKVHLQQQAEQRRTAYTLPEKIPEASSEEEREELAISTYTRF